MSFDSADAIHAAEDAFHRQAACVQAIADAITSGESWTVHFPSTLEQRIHECVAEAEAFCRCDCDENYNPDDPNDQECGCPCHA